MLSPLGPVLERTDHPAWHVGPHLRLVPAGWGWFSLALVLNLTLTLKEVWANHEAVSLQRASTFIGARTEIHFKFFFFKKESSEKQIVLMRMSLGKQAMFDQHLLPTRSRGKPLLGGMLE